jgi:hypothetical protein
MVILVQPDLAAQGPHFSGKMFAVAVVARQEWWRRRDAILPRIKVVMKTKRVM